MFRQSPGESETARRFGGPAPSLSPGAGRRPTRRRPSKRRRAGRERRLRPPCSRSRLDTHPRGNGTHPPSPFWGIGAAVDLPMKPLRPGEGKGPMRRGPFLALARLHTSFPDRCPPGDERVTPFGGAVGCAHGAETEAVTAYSVARPDLPEAEAASLWARRLSVAGLAAAAATFCALAVQTAHGASAVPRCPRSSPTGSTTRSACSPARRAWCVVSAAAAGAALGLDRRRDLRVDVRRHLLHDRAAEPRLAAVPLVRRSRLPRLLRPRLRRPRAARALVGRRLPRLRLGGRADRRVHRVRARDGSRPRACLAHLDRQLRRHRHQSRLPGRRRAAARTRLLRLRPLGLAARPDVARRRHRPRRLCRLRLRVSRRGRARHLPVRRLARPRLAGRVRAHRRRMP